MYLVAVEKILESWYTEPDFTEADLGPLWLSFRKAPWVHLGDAHPFRDSPAAVRLRSTNMRSWDNTDASTDVSGSFFPVIKKI